jgi:hypothetical protein
VWARDGCFPSPLLLAAKASRKGHQRQCELLLRTVNPALALVLVPERKLELNRALRGSLPNQKPI